MGSPELGKPVACGCQWPLSVPPGRFVPSRVRPPSATRTGGASLDHLAAFTPVSTTNYHEKTRVVQTLLSRFSTLRLTVLSAFVAPPLRPVVAAAAPAASRGAGPARRSPPPRSTTPVRTNPRRRPASHELARRSQRICRSACEAGRAVLAPARPTRPTDDDASRVPTPRSRVRLANGVADQSSRAHPSSARGWPPVLLYWTAVLDILARGAPSGAVRLLAVGMTVVRPVR